MPESKPAKDKQVASPHQEPPIVLLERAKDTRTETKLVVRFYRRMSVRRLFPLVVELPASGESANPKGPPMPVVIRPVVPGALVVPAQNGVDLARPGTKATFQITPLARGRLADARVDVCREGRVLQRIPLRMRATSQRLTWVLALLTLVIPPILLYTTKYHPLQSTMLTPLRGFGEGEKDETPPPPPPPPGGVLSRPPVPPTPPKERSASTAVSQRLLPGKSLQYELKRNLPELPGRDGLTEVLGTVYGTACAWSDGGIPLAFYTGALLAGLTAISWFTHCGRKGRRRGEGLSYPG